VDWNLLGCARGHLTYAPTEVSLRRHLHVDTPGGSAWRCLRCGTYVVGEPRHSGPAADAPVPLRGQLLRDAVVLRLLAVERSLRSLVVFALAYGVYRFRADRDDLRHAFATDLPLLQPLARQLGWDLDNSSLVHTVQSFLQAPSATLAWIAIGLTGYGILQVGEAIGLFLLTRWGEYLAAVATSLLIPVEIYELFHRITWLRLAAFALNVAAVAFIVYRKRLFGARGGRAAHEREREAESLIQVAIAAGETTGRGESGANGGRRRTAAKKKKAPR
jgi:uncharacterized membrane protein (DUF2068 family)